MQAVVTALYCKILIILGLAFPMAEVISDNVPKGYYQLFYVYLFLGSLVFLLFIYIDLLKTRAKRSAAVRTAKRRSITLSRNRDEADNGTDDLGKDNVAAAAAMAAASNTTPRPRVHYGSFYLRLGAVCKFFFSELFNLFFQ